MTNVTKVPLRDDRVRSDAGPMTPNTAVFHPTHGRCLFNRPLLTKPGRAYVEKKGNLIEVSISELKTLALHLAHRREVAADFAQQLVGRLRDTGDRYTFIIECGFDCVDAANEWARSITGRDIPVSCLRTYDKGGFEVRYNGPHYDIPCELEFVPTGVGGGVHDQVAVGISDGSHVKFNWKETGEELLRAGLAWRAPQPR
jgi:hypothetical protein